MFMINEILVFLFLISICTALPPEYHAKYGTVHGAENSEFVAKPGSDLDHEHETEETGADHLHVPIVEGDIRLDTNLVKLRDEETGKSRDVMNYDGYIPWSDATVPYTFPDGTGAALEKVVLSAIQDFYKYTCVKFIPRTDENDYVVFINEPGCWSFIGRKGGMQPISLGPGCQYKGTALHEMMHSLGFFHEHTRLDRDKYVKINFQNIVVGKEANFKKYSKGIASYFGESYDYYSIMHYRQKAFSHNRKMTIIPKDRSVDVKKLGQRSGLSDIDVIQLNRAYKCSDKASSTPKPTTPKPTTPKPSTPMPSTPMPSTPKPSTPKPSTPKHSTPKHSTPKHSTPKHSTAKHSTPKRSTPKRSTPKRSTPEPSTPEPSTPEPSTPEPSAPEPSAPEPSAPEPSAPEPSAPEPSTTEPSITEPSIPPTSKQKPIHILFPNSNGNSIHQPKPSLSIAIGSKIIYPTPRICPQWSQCSHWKMPTSTAYLNVPGGTHVTCHSRIGYSCWSPDGGIAHKRPFNCSCYQSSPCTCTCTTIIPFTQAKRFICQKRKKGKRTSGKGKLLDMRCMKEAKTRSGITPKFDCQTEEGILKMRFVPKKHKKIKVS